MEEHNHMMHHQQASSKLEYLKFTGVMLMITILAYIWTPSGNLTLFSYMESFMGVFFVVFAAFKLFNIREFAYGFQSYDIIAKKSIQYAFAYPFFQLLFGVLYLAGNGASLLLNVAVLIVSFVSSIGVAKSILNKEDVHCVCLGNVIKLPLSRISFVEDVGMALMAMVMILL